MSAKRKAKPNRRSTGTFDLVDATTAARNYNIAVDFVAFLVIYHDNHPQAPYVKDGSEENVIYQCRQLTKNTVQRYIGE